jgi:arginine exporter protein ArgO
MKYTPKKKHHQNPQILTTSQVFCLTLIITMVLYFTGMFTVSAVNALEPWLQNIVYAAGRVPILFVVLFFALKKDKEPEDEVQK